MKASWMAPARRVGLVKYSIGLAVLAGFFWVGSAAADSLRVFSPPDAVWVSQSELFLAGAVDAGAETVKISGAGKVEVGEGGVFGAVVGLKRGLNEIGIKGGGSELTVRIFYAADAKNQPPAGFTRFYSHIEPPARSCDQCHRLRDGAYDFKRIIPARADCYECHDDMGQAAHVHGPVGAGVCISCHSPHGSANPSFTLKEGAELCLDCHRDRQDEFDREHPHPPILDGCTDCHNPHESANRYQLEYDGDSLSALCLNCHDEGMFNRDTMHSPVGEGECLACHLPHSSANAALLTTPLAEGALCFECHDYLQEDFEMEYLHAPVEESCMTCHDPHSSQAASLLREAGGALCAGCHRDYNPEIYEAIDSAKVDHPPVAEGECLACHRPHSANQAALLADPMETLCFSCHDSFGEVIASKKNRHGPVETGECTACHDVHGAQFSRLLARHYPEGFYAEYTKNQYDLCFGCHNQDLARTRRTETLTSFRDGSFNLHYFHVNSEKGRTCTACHNAHAADQAKHVRDEVPFGAWSYPIDYTKTPTGGGCVVGCHAPKKYDRLSPVATR